MTQYLTTEDPVIAETIRPRIQEGGTAPLSETAELLGVDPAGFQ